MQMDTPQTSYRNIDVNAIGSIVPLIGPGGIRIRSWYYFNSTGATVYLKLYNKATAATNGDTPQHTIPIPAGAAANVANAFWNFPAGLSIRATTGVADADNTGPAANGCIVNIGYT